MPGNWRRDPADGGADGEQHRRRLAGMGFRERPREREQPWLCSQGVRKQVSEDVPSLDEGMRLARKSTMTKKDSEPAHSMRAATMPLQ